MMRIKTAIFVLSAILFSSCSQKVAEQGSVVVDGDQVVVKPKQYDNAFRNPMMGLRDVFAVGLDPVPERYPLPFGSIYKEYIPWNKIENKASDGVDKVVAYTNRRWEGIEKKNIKVIPRVYLHWMGTPPVTLPDSLDGIRFPSDIPYSQKEGDPYPMQGGYFHPDFQKRVAALVKKIGEAWDNDPRVAYVEMGIIGQWGEHHSPMIGTDWKPHDADSHTENVTWIKGIEKTLGDAFTEAFKNKKVMVRYAYDFEDYDFGYYWDSWAVQQEDIRGYEWLTKTGDKWKKQVIGGELCWNNWGDFAKYKTLTQALETDTARHKILKQIRELHANHLGYFSYGRPEIDFSQPDLFKNAQLLQKALGYHFILEEFKYDKQINNHKSFEVNFKIKNEGSSPFYYDWPVEISLLDKTTKQKVWGKVLNDVKISQWMPGDKWDDKAQKYSIAPQVYEINQTLTLDSNIPVGEYIIAISVLDPAGNVPSLRLSTANYFTGGVHPMGYVGVGKDISVYEIPSGEFNDIFSDVSLHYVVNK